MGYGGSIYGGSKYLQERQKQELAAVEQFETKNRMASLLEKAGGSDKSVREHYALTADEQAALTEAKAEWDKEQADGEAFVKAFKSANWANGYSLPRD